MTLDRRRFLQLIGAGAAGAAVGSLAPGVARAQSAPFPGLGDVELAILNGKVFTNDPAMPFARAIASSSGRIVATGADEQIRPLIGPRTMVIDARGRTVIPGLNDSHLHVTRAGRFFNLELRWDGVKSLARGLDMVRGQAGRTPTGQWVRVIGGWSPFQFEERRPPTVAELNEAAPDTPAFVLFLYSRGYLNRAGVQALGLSESTPPPKGGRYEFVDGGAILHAEPDPTILYIAIARLPHLTLAGQVNGSLHFYRELNRFGLTSAIDAGGGGHLFPDDYRASMELATRNEIALRVSMHLFPQKPGRESEDFREWARLNRAGQQMAARLHGFELEGGGEFLTWAAGDYENFLAPRPEQGPQMEPELEEIARFLISIRWPIRIHATYDESITRILNVFERINRDTPFDGLRWAIDHAETISPRNIERVRALGGGIAIQNRMAFAGEYFLERYGPSAAAAAPPFRALIESGVPLGLGTDATRVSSYNPWLALAWAVTGRTLGGAELQPPGQRLTREEALRLMTLGSAWFSGDDHEKGRLAPGCLADCAVLSDDYFSIAEHRISTIESALTILDGHVVYAAGPFESLDPGPPSQATPEWSPVRGFGGYQT